MPRWIALLALLVACEGPTTALEAEPPDTTTPLPPVEEPPGTGRVFVLDDVTISEDGLDLDGRCTEQGCIDNRTGPFVARRFGDVFARPLEEGRMIVLLEVAQLDAPYEGSDEHVELRVYRGYDVDARPENNFSVPAGEDTCCTFRIANASIFGDLPKRARFRMPAHIDNRQLEVDAPAAVEIPWPLAIRTLPQTLRLERARVRMHLPTDLETAEDGLLGGVAAFGALDAIDNPYCRTISPRCPTPHTSMLDLVLQLGLQADIDLDGDGLECVLDGDGDGRADLCCDGVDEASACGALACRGATVAPLDAEDPSSCLQDPRMADGFSMTFGFSAVAATVQWYP